MRPLGVLLPILLLLLLAALLLGHLMFGPVKIPASAVWNALFDPGASEVPWVRIVREVRLPEALTALLVGGGLAVSGAMLQTLFGNPLAGPSVLGISSGASLGVALLFLGGPFLPALLGGSDLALVLSACMGALAVLAVVIAADRRVNDGITLLIVGLMIGYFSSALIGLLEVAAGERALKGFVLWGMGTFATTTLDRLPLLAIPVVAGSLFCIWWAKPLNAMLLGDAYARSMGVEVRRLRRGVIIVTGVLAGTCTAFCGPIAFLGLATPHVVRGVLRTEDHRIVLPYSLGMGALLALVCDLIVRLTGPVHAMPLNAVTALLGVPVVVMVLVRGRRWARMS
ncbi:MAG: iron ABC transporter permease [Flavobacteriales bacterium]|nr:iron ABC transporter permease [Flavobacteriales bacterium]MCB9193761.1 iron ABC transporter permease [Flavobacteriales bacterium]